MRRARTLRRTMSLPEVMLWQRLRARPGELKFRRQHPVLAYVVDFYCAAARLVIEIDGEAHSRGDRPMRDAARDRAIEALGLTIMRLPASAILSDADAVADALVASALPLHRPAGGPPPHAWHGEDPAGAC